MDAQTTMTQMTDAADASLVAMAKAGDQAAMDELVDKYWTMAYRVALRILRSHEDAEEVAQDALWAVTTHLATFREDACFRTWLHRIAVNHSLMALRRRRVRAPGSLYPISVDTLPAGVGGPRTPEELLLENECERLMDEGLSRVPAIFSVVLRLAAREGRSTDEIADHVGISASAVKTRVHRGRAFLQREILPRLCVKTARAPELRKGHQRCRREAEPTLAA
jgi:RNA polymerase sigma-70 factor (ECF subfamily)